MFHSFRIAQIADWTALCGLVFMLSMLFFWQRSKQFYMSLLLAVLFTAMLLYAVYLIKKQLQTKITDRSVHRKRMERIAYALLMLPYTDATEAAACALAEKFSIILTHPLAEHKYVEGFMKDGRRIAISLHQSPSPLSVEAVYDFHRIRKGIPGVIMCIKMPTKQTLEYAESLTPALKLQPIQELSFDESLLKDASYEQIPKKKRTAAFPFQSGYTQAVRCICFSFLLIIGYLATGQRSILFPALALVFYALYCKRTLKKDTLL